MCRVLGSRDKLKKKKWEGASPSFCSSSVPRQHSQHHSGGSSERAMTPNPPGILGTFSLWFQVTTCTHTHSHTETYAHAHTLYSSVLYFCCLYRVGFVSFASLLPYLSFTLILNSHTYPLGWTTTWTDAWTWGWIQSRSLVQILTLMVNTTQWRLKLVHIHTKTLQGLLPILSMGPKFRLIVTRRTTQNSGKNFWHSVKLQLTFVRDNSVPKNSHVKESFSSATQMWLYSVNVDLCWMCECVVCGTQK